MLDSPFEYCPLCREYVLLDQTAQECAREHHCSLHECPLRKLFTGIDFATMPKASPRHAREKTRG
jgi:hypothetical protein